MKYYILFVYIFTITICNSSAQQIIIPVENYIDYWDNDDLEIPDGAHIKDVNGLLDKYVGTWKGTYQGKNYEFYIKKVTLKSKVSNLLKDRLIMRYKIIGISGEIIADNTYMNDEEPLIIDGWYLAKTKTYYVLNYFGFDGECGQNGRIYISIKNTNSNLMGLRLSVYGEVDPNCTEIASQVLPTNNMLLTRQ